MEMLNGNKMVKIHENIWKCWDKQFIKYFAFHYVYFVITLYHYRIIKYVAILVIYYYWIFSVSIRFSYGNVVHCGGGVGRN